MSGERSSAAPPILTGGMMLRIGRMNGSIALDNPS